MQAMGIRIKGYEVDISAMREWKDKIVNKLDAGIKELCARHNIEIFQGTARFVSSNEISIEGKSDVTRVQFKNAIIATGSSALPVPGFPWTHPRVMSSTEALNLERIPKRLVIIGGGYIGTEMGTVYGKLGSEVHILEMESRILSHLDQDIVEVMTRKLSQFNVHAHTSTKALGMEDIPDGVRVSIDTQGQKSTIDAEAVMVVVGRKPNSQDLGLEHTRVTLDSKEFVKVDHQMRTTDPHIFAIGDLVGNPMLAHKASREGKVAAEVISGLPSAFDNKVIPLVVFNDPEIASAGITQEEATEKGMDVIIGKFPFGALGRAMTLNKTEGFAKIIAHKQSKAILGIHCVGAGASDLISEASLAIEMGATLDDIALTIHPHPTLPEIMMEASEAGLGKSIHQFIKHT
jgi:dihydrolipoamide dehydrogenase